MMISNEGDKDLTRILIVLKPSLESYLAVLKLLKSREVLWVSPNPYLAHKALKGRKAKIFSFNTRRFNSVSVNPSNLQEILLQITRNTKSNCAVVLACLSELLAIHGLSRLYGFLLHLLSAVEERGGIIVGMLIEGAQNGSDEIVISTLFDTALRIQQRNDELMFVPLISTNNGFLEPLTNEVNFGTTLP